MSLKFPCALFPLLTMVVLRHEISNTLTNPYTWVALCPLLGYSNNLVFPRAIKYSTKKKRSLDTFWKITISNITVLVKSQLCIIFTSSWKYFEVAYYATETVLFTIKCNTRWNWKLNQYCVVMLQLLAIISAVILLILHPLSLHQQTSVSKPVYTRPSLFSLHRITVIGVTWFPSN